MSSKPLEGRPRTTPAPTRAIPVGEPFHRLEPVTRGRPVIAAAIAATATATTAKTAAETTATATEATVTKATATETTIISLDMDFANPQPVETATAQLGSKFVCDHRGLMLTPGVLRQVVDLVDKILAVDVPDGISEEGGVGLPENILRDGSSGLLQVRKDGGKRVNLGHIERSALKVGASLDG